MRALVGVAAMVGDFVEADVDRSVVVLSGFAQPLAIAPVNAHATKKSFLFISPSRPRSLDEYAVGGAVNADVRIGDD